MKKHLIPILALAMLSVGSVRAEEGAGGPTSPAAAASGPTTPATLSAADYEISIGAADAKVVLTEYTSFSCSHCARFAKEVLPGIETDYIATGKVRLVIHEVYVDRFGLSGALLARCAGEAGYAGMSRAIFAAWDDWIQAKDAPEMMEKLAAIAAGQGVSPDQARNCMNDMELAKGLVGASAQAISADAVEGTPTLLIDGVKATDRSAAGLKTAIDAALAK